MNNKAVARQVDDGIISIVKREGLAERRAARPAAKSGLS